MRIINDLSENKKSQKGYIYQTSIPLSELFTLIEKFFNIEIYSQEKGWKEIYKLEKK